jgi:hypothetical protein
MKEIKKDNYMSKNYHDINTEDYNTMRSMISDIELKLIQVDPMTQRWFYSFMKEVIYEAWVDANNEDSNVFIKNNLK